MSHVPVIVVGASLGGVEAIRSRAGQLPADLAAAVFVVLHIGAHKSGLPWLLNQSGPLHANHAGDGDPIHPGQIYVAPPDHHLVIEPGHMRLTRGPRENWARPAIDPLFRSAARAYGPDVIGVILTGGLNDGTAGLIEIEQHNGTTVVQHPDDAAHPSMPLSALKHVAVDHCLPLAQIPALLAKLVAERNASALLNKAQPDTYTDSVPRTASRRKKRLPVGSWQKCRTLTLGDMVSRSSTTRLTSCCPASMLNQKWVGLVTSYSRKRSIRVVCIKQVESGV